MFTASRKDRVAGLLLCVLVIVMSMVSPICPACDGLGGNHNHSTTVAGSLLLPAIDSCNGVCSCCGFHWIEQISMQLPGTNYVAEISSVTDGGYPSRLTPPPFLPPRC